MLVVVIKTGRSFNLSRNSVISSPFTSTADISSCVVNTAKVVVTGYVDSLYNEKKSFSAVNNSSLKWNFRANICGEFTERFDSGKYYGSSSLD